jgi:hypothetical protein
MEASLEDGVFHIHILNISMGVVTGACPAEYSPLGELSVDMDI